MKKNVLLALVAALALAVGLSSVAVAGVANGDAQASAKKGKGKAKGCKAKKGKGKGKGCKGATSGLPLKTGTYDGGNSVGLEVKGKKATLNYTASFGGGPTCIPIPLALDALSVTSTASSFKASGSASNPLFAVKWSIVVQPNLSYKLTIDSALSGDDTVPCNKPGVVITGKLSKGG